MKALPRHYEFDFPRKRPKSRASVVGVPRVVGPRRAARAPRRRAEKVGSAAGRHPRNDGEVPRNEVAIGGKEACGEVTEAH